MPLQRGIADVDPARSAGSSRSMHVSRIHAITLALSPPRRDTRAFARLARAVGRSGPVQLRHGRIASPAMLMLTRSHGGEDRLAMVLNRLLRRRGSGVQPLLTLTGALARLDLRQLTLDHIGLTIDPRALSGFERRLVLRELWRAGGARSYPGRPDWRFLFPGDPVKFEIAFDETAGADVVVQLDIQTPYPLHRLRQMFSPSEQQEIPGLSRHAVSTFVQTQLLGPGLRLDLRARPKNRRDTFTRWLLANTLRSKPMA